MTKALHAGMAASNGIMAALMAKQVLMKVKKHWKVHSVFFMFMDMEKNLI